MKEVKIFDMRFFKYKSASSEKDFCRDVNCLLKNEIWFSPPCLLNDPFEGTFTLDHLNTIEIPNDDDTFVNYESWQTSFAGMGILSLSEENDNPVLWSHYADNHRGYCIEYGLQNIFVPGTSPKIEEMSLLGYPVSYISRPFEFSKRTDNKRRFLNKYLPWEYEHEFRFTVKKYGIYETNENCIKAIYLGANCSIEVEQTLSMVCQKKKIKLFKSKIMKNSFKLLFDEIYY